MSAKWLNPCTVSGWNVEGNFPFSEKEDLKNMCYVLQKVTLKMNRKENKIKISSKHKNTDAPNIKISFENIEGISLFDEDFQGENAWKAKKG